MKHRRRRFCDPACLSSGVFDQAFASPVVWLTALLTAWTAVLPSVTVRALSVILKVHDKHKVRHEKVKGKLLSVYTNQTHLEVGTAAHSGAPLVHPCPYFFHNCFKVCHVLYSLQPSISSPVMGLSALALVC